MNPQERFKARQQARMQANQNVEPQKVMQQKKVEPSKVMPQKKVVPLAQAKQGKVAIKKVNKTDKGIVISFTKV